MDQIEKHIRPLVDWLNSLPGVKTQYSCHGHMGRPEAWVIFSAPDLELPYAFWSKLADMNAVSYYRAGPKFRYSWTVRPWFCLYNGRPGFRIEGYPLSHGKEWKKFLMRVELPEEVDNLEKLLSCVDKEPYQKEAAEDKPPMPIKPSSTRVFSLAMGTPVGVGGDVVSANVTFDQLGHALTYHLLSEKATPALVSCALEHGLALWSVAGMLRMLRLEGAFKKTPWSDGYFTAGRKVFLVVRPRVK